jgi:hypothetical protein
MQRENTEQNTKRTTRFTVTGKYSNALVWHR